MSLFFAYVDSWFSNAAAHILRNGKYRIHKDDRKTSRYVETIPRGYKTFFKLSSAEHEISTAHKIMLK